MKVELEMNKKILEKIYNILKICPPEKLPTEGLYHEEM